MSSNLNNTNEAKFYVNGTVIFNAGKLPRYIHIIKRGEVRLMKIVNNHLHVFQVCKTGEIINDISVLTNKKLDYCAIAFSDVEIISIEASDVRSVINKCPKWIPDIFTTLCERLTDSLEIIHEHNLHSGPIDHSYIISKEEEKLLLQRLSEFKD